MEMSGGLLAIVLLLWLLFELLLLLVLLDARIRGRMMHKWGRRPSCYRCCPALHCPLAQRASR